MDRRFFTVVGASLLFALVVSLLFYQMVTGSRGRSGAKVALRDVVTAARPLSLGIIVAPGDVKLVQVPAAQFPIGGFSKLAEVVGRPVISNVLIDEPVRAGRLAARGSGQGLAPSIPTGMRAVSVRVNDVVGVAGFVLPGMRVDVLVTGRPPHQETTITRTILQDILVLSAGQNIAPDARGQPVNVPVVTLLVTPPQAETLTLASEWRIQLVLRNAGDRTIEPTGGRDLNGMLGQAAEPAPSPSATAMAPARARRADVEPAPPAPKLVDEIIVFRGTQKTVEQVRVKTP